MKRHLNSQYKLNSSRVRILTPKIRFAPLYFNEPPVSPAYHGAYISHLMLL